MPVIQLKILKSKKKKKSIAINMLRKKRKCMHIKCLIQTKKGRKGGDTCARSPHKGVL